MGLEEGRMNQSEQIGELVAAIGAIMADVGYVRGTGRNDHQRYNYTSDEDLAAAIQPALVKHGCALLPVGTSVTESTVAVKNGEAQRVIIAVTWRLGHKSGQWMQLETVGEGVDKQDKATAKALTGARKYAMRLIFCVPTGDDNEKEAEVGGKVAQTAAKSADFSPFVMGLLGQIEGLQARKVKNADAAAAKVYDHARAGLSDDDIKESLSKLIDWVADNS